MRKNSFCHEVSGNFHETVDSFYKFPKVSSTFYKEKSLKMPRFFFKHFFESKRVIIIKNERSMEHSLYESHWFKGFHVILNPIFLGGNDVIDDAIFD